MDTAVLWKVVLQKLISVRDNVEIYWTWAWSKLKVFQRDRRKKHKLTPLPYCLFPLSVLIPLFLIAETQWTLTVTHKHDRYYRRFWGTTFVEIAVNVIKIWEAFNVGAYCEHSRTVLNSTRQEYTRVTNRNIEMLCYTAIRLISN